MYNKLNYLEIIFSCTRIIKRCSVLIISCAILTYNYNLCSAFRKTIAERDKVFEELGEFLQLKNSIENIAVSLCAFFFERRTYQTADKYLRY